MKLSRKLIPAFIMLLVSAVLMSTASFAWFSSNISATAENFNVKIAAANTLLIKDADGDDDYATFVRFDDDDAANKLAMAPVSTAILSEPAFFQLGNASGVTPDSAEAGEGSTFVEAEAENYVVKNLLLRATGESEDLGALGLRVTAVQEAESDINNSLRILVVITDEESEAFTFYINPFGEDLVKPVLKEGGATEDGVVDTDAIAAEDQLDGDEYAEFQILDNLVAEEEYAVAIYIWFEGQDESCYANNATSLAGIEIDFEFYLVDAVGD